MNPTPVESFVRARRLGIVFRLGDDGEIFATLPEDMAQPPAWLREVKQAEPEALAFAIALGAAMERGGGDVGALLSVKTLEIRVQ
jgi:hypothetical protein